METGQSICHVPQFSGVDYSSWKFRLMALLREKGLSKHVEGDLTRGAAGSAEEILWIGNDAKAMNCIIRSLADSHLEYVQGKNTAYEMISSLNQVFERKSIGTRVYLKKKIMSLKCGIDKSLSEFFVEFDGAIRAYKNCGGKLDDLEIVIDLLMAMPDCYIHVVTTLELMDESSLTLERVKSCLLEAEMKRSSRTFELETLSDSIALQSQKTRRAEFVCFKCGMKGHKANKCSGKFKKQSNLSDLSSVKSFAMMGLSGKYEEKKKVTCLIDSGCTDHIINNAEFLRRKEEYPNVSINLAKKGESMNAVRIGSLDISTMVGGNIMKGSLNNVLVVPSARQNLISVSQIDRKGGTVIFKNGTVKIYMNDMLIGSGKLQN